MSRVKCRSGLGRSAADLDPGPFPADNQPCPHRSATAPGNLWKEVATVAKVILSTLGLFALSAAATAGPPSPKTEGRRPQPAPSYQFAPPVRLEAAGKPIDTDVGHAAPLVVDFDGDGTNDLLVGQFGEGILWFYKNIGTNAHPRYAAGVKFKEGKPDGRVPTG
jgi:hypothetical protein